MRSQLVRRGRKSDRRARRRPLLWLSCALVAGSVAAIVTAASELVVFSSTLGDFTDLDFAISNKNPASIEDFIDDGGSLHDLYSRSSALELAAEEASLPAIEALIRGGAPTYLDNSRADLLGIYIANSRSSNIVSEVQSLMVLGLSPCKAVSNSSTLVSERLFEKLGSNVSEEDGELIRSLELAEKGCKSSASVGERMWIQRYRLVFLGTFSIVMLGFVWYVFGSTAKMSARRDVKQGELADEI